MALFAIHQLVGLVIEERIQPAGLNPERDYLVRFQDDARQLTLNGRRLMKDGVDVNLTAEQSAEIVYVAPLNP